MMVAPNRFHPLVPWAREVSSPAPRRVGSRPLAGEDGVEVAGGEPAVHGGVPERPVDVGAAGQRGEFDGVGHLLQDPFGADGGGFFEPHRRAGPEGQERLLGRRCGHGRGNRRAPCRGGSGK